MKKQFLLFIFTAVIFLPSMTYSQTNKKAPEYLGVMGPINFDSTSYKLDWSSHPADAYYKQEYLPAGQVTGKFKSMLLLEVLVSDQTVKEIAAQKIEELKQMKQTNPMVNFNSFENPNTGEYIVDFLLTANKADGSISIIERNVYRYAAFTTKSGQKAILLFGASQREYGNKATAFLKGMKTNKDKLVNLVAKYQLPGITL